MSGYDNDIDKLSNFDILNRINMLQVTNGYQNDNSSESGESETPEIGESETPKIEMKNNEFNNFKLLNLDDDISFTGKSIAGYKTAFFCEPYKFVFDSGIDFSKNSNIIFITHSHYDHVRELYSNILNSECSDRELIIFIPYGKNGNDAQNIINYIHSIHKMTKNINPMQKELTLPKFTFVTVKPYNNFYFNKNFELQNGYQLKTKRYSNKNTSFNSLNLESGYSTPDETNTISTSNNSTPERKKRKFCEINTVNKNYEIIDEDDCYDILYDSKSFKIETIPCTHSVPCNAYGIIKIKSSLKEEYFTIIDGKKKCILNKSDFEERKKNNTMNEIKDVKLNPQFIFFGDTDHNVFYNNHDIIKKYPNIIVECSFFCTNTIKKAKKDKHMHFTNLERIINEFNTTNFYLIHVSKRYNSSFIANIKNEIFAKYQNRVNIIC